MGVYNSNIHHDQPKFETSKVKKSNDISATSLSMISNQIHNDRNINIHVRQGADSKFKSRNDDGAQTKNDEYENAKKFLYDFHHDLHKSKLKSFKLDVIHEALECSSSGKSTRFKLHLSKKQPTYSSNLSSLALVDAVSTIPNDVKDKNCRNRNVSLSPLTQDKDVISTGSSISNSNKNNKRKINDDNDIGLSEEEKEESKPELHTIDSVECDDELSSNDDSVDTSWGYFTYDYERGIPSSPSRNRQKRLMTLHPRSTEYSRYHHYQDNDDKWFSSPFFSKQSLLKRSGQHHLTKKRSTVFFDKSFSF